MTVNGWVMQALDGIPTQGESFDYKNLHVTVLEMDGKRVEKVRIIIRAPISCEKEPGN